MSCCLDNRWNSHSDAVIRDVAKNHRVGADVYVIADIYSAKQLCSGSDIYVITNNGSALILYPPEADHDPIPNAAIISYLCIAAYDYSSEVIDSKITPQFNFAGQFDPGYNLHELVQNSVDERQELSKDKRSNLVPPTTKAVNDQSPKTLACPVSVMGLKVASDIPEHLQRLASN